MESSGRVVWLDTARGTAIISVLICHVTEAIYSLNLEFMSGVERHTKILVFTLFTFGRLGVPFFLFITGYLLLDRSYGLQGTRRFWSKNLLRLLISVEIWIVVYNLFLRWLEESEICANVLIKNIFFLKNVEMSHTWYIPMILGMYMFIPFVADALQYIEVNTLRMPLSVVCVYLFMLPAMNVICQAYGYNLGTNLLSLDYGGGIYGLYLIMGYLLKKGILKKFRTGSLMLWGGVTFWATVRMQLLSYEHGNVYNVWYNNLFLLLCSMMFFEIFSRTHMKRKYWVWSSLSKCSFGIYLVHNLVLRVLRVHVPQGKEPLLRFTQFFMITFIVSWLITEGISRIPRIGKWLLYIK